MEGADSTTQAPIKLVKVKTLMHANANANLGYFGQGPRSLTVKLLN